MEKQWKNKCKNKCNNKYTEFYGDHYGDLMDTRAFYKIGDPAITKLFKDSGYFNKYRKKFNLPEV